MSHRHKLNQRKSYSTSPASSASSPKSWATPVQSTQQNARLSQAVGIKPATEEEKSSALTRFEKMDFTTSQRQGKKHVSIRQKNCFDISCSSLMELEQEAA